VPDTPSTTASAAPAPSRRFFPWWLPGLAIGALAAAGAVFVTQARLSAEGTHKAEALLQLCPQDSVSWNHQQALLLRSRDLLTRVLAEPDVAQLPSVKGLTDPVGDLEKRLAVADVPPDLQAVTLTGNDPDELKVVLNHLLKRYVDDATAFARKERADQVQKLEQHSETLRLEIESAEKTIELLGKANQTAGGSDGGREAARRALLQRRTEMMDAEYNRVNRELIGLEAEITVLKRQAEKKVGAPQPDAKRDARIGELTSAIEIKKEERERLRAERDEVQKLVVAACCEGPNLDVMRRSLNPRREQLQKLDVQLDELRLGLRPISPVAVRGEVTVAPARTSAEWRRDVGPPAAIAFAAGFALATGFSLVGLVFRVLRRAAEPVR
jgi:hypothetical protein